MAIITTDTDVLVVPTNLLNRFRTTKGRDELKPIQDPDGDWILGMEILNDPAWSSLLKEEDGIPAQALENLLTTKKYKYDDSTFI
jgi:hypothetical protein